MYTNTYCPIRFPSSRDKESMPPLFCNRNRKLLRISRFVRTLILFYYNTDTMMCITRNFFKKKKTTLVMFYPLGKFSATNESVILWLVLTFPSARYFFFLTTNLAPIEKRQEIIFDLGLKVSFFFPRDFFCKGEKP